MFLLAFVFILEFFVHIQAQALTANDTLLEESNNCKCVIYHQCEEQVQVPNDGRFLIDVRLKSVSNNNSTILTCSDKNYWCCKEKVDSTTSSTTLLVTKGINTTNIGVDYCGMPRTAFRLRVLTEDDDSAATVTGEMPWIATIYKRTEDNRHQFKCIGSLIHPKVVLTAAHCILSSKSGELTVIANAKQSYQSVGEDATDERAVFKIIKHPNYYSGGLFNDIALLILETKFDLSKLSHLNSICLPASNQRFPVGKRCLAVGWGLTHRQPTSVLKKVDVPLIDFEKCEMLLRQTNLGNYFQLDESFLCAGGEAGKDTCRGDGGGPLVCQEAEDKFILIGVVSWGVDCGKVNVPGVYADVAKFRGWIDEELGKHKRNLDN